MQRPFLSTTKSAKTETTIAFTFSSSRKSMMWPSTNPPTFSFTSRHRDLPAAWRRNPTSPPQATGESQHSTKPTTATVNQFTPSVQMQPFPVMVFVRQKKKTMLFSLAWVIFFPLFRLTMDYGLNGACFLQIMASNGATRDQLLSSARKGWVFIMGFGWKQIIKISGETVQ